MPRSTFWSLYWIERKAFEYWEGSFHYVCKVGYRKKVGFAINRGITRAAKKKASRNAVLLELGEQQTWLWHPQSPFADLFESKQKSYMYATEATTEKHLRPIFKPFMSGERDAARLKVWFRLRYKNMHCILHRKKRRQRFFREDFFVFFTTSKLIYEVCPVMERRLKRLSLLCVKNLSTILFALQRIGL